MPQKKGKGSGGSQPGPGLDPEKIKRDLKKEIEAEVYRIRLQRFLLRVDVKSSIGVGDFDTWEEEFEWGFPRSAPGMTDEQRSQPYGNSPQERPQLRKVSREYPPPDAGKPQPGKP